MVRFQEKWCKNVFNMNHPAYTDQIWHNLIQCVSRITQSIKEPLTGFDHAIVKRQLYHMMFLDENPTDPFETIAYNDSEHMDDYSGLSGMLVKFINSGLPTSSNMSFNEFLKLPNWLADWALEWSLKQTVSKSDDTDDALRKLEIEMQKEAEKSKKNPSQFKGNY